MSSPQRILVTPRSLTADALDSPELEPLRSRNFQLVGSLPGGLPSEDELLTLLPGCVGWLAGVELITSRVLGAATDLRVISRNGTGTDGIDLAAAERAGVKVLRAAGANAQGVAELALTLALCGLRRVASLSTALKAGRWERVPGAELADVTVGVLGLGAVGRRTAAMFDALGARVVAYDPYVSAPSVPVTGLDELLSAADVVTLHCPPTPEARPVISAPQLCRMKRGAVLVNTARSTLVDGDAVLDALEDGTLAAYAVDAFDTEPPEPSALLSHPHTIATPHLGGYTRASVSRATAMAVANLLSALEER